MNARILAVLLILAGGVAFGQTPGPYGVFGGPIPSTKLPSGAPVGTIAFTSDQGMLVSNGTTWTVNSSTTPIASGTVLGNSSGSPAAPSAQGFSPIRVVDITAYGAKCNFTTDDSAAWQSAITAALAIANFDDTAPDSPLSVTLRGCSTGQSLVKTTLNFTGFTGTSNNQAKAVNVDMTGSCIIGQTNGTAVINALGARWITWNNLCIYGSTTNTPSIGMQIGRLTSLASADLMTFNHPVISGSFTTATFYNFASETNLFLYPDFSNVYATGTPITLIEDGYNHFGISGAPTDSAASFNANIFIGGNIIGSTVGNALWLGGTSGHKFIGTYLNVASPNSSPAIVVYTETSNQITNGLYLDVHVEDLAASTIQFAGTYATPTINSFTYRNFNDQSSGSILSLGGSVTSVTINNAVIDVDSVLNTGVTLFDTAANYHFTGTVQVPLSAQWSTPAGFAGSICIAAACDGYKNPGGSNTNTAAGNSALSGAVTGTYNTAFGLAALTSNLGGSNNTAMGFDALHANVTGNYSTAVGQNALEASTANYNAAFGYQAGYYISSGTDNTAVGANALMGASGALQTGGYNTGVGYGALDTCQGACDTNTALGLLAGSSITTGANNTVIGGNVGSSTLTTGQSNILIGTSSATTTVASGTISEVNIGGALIGYDIITGISCTAGNGCGTGGGTIGGQGTFYFTITAGTVSTTNPFTLTMPAAPTDWSCSAKDRTTNLIGYQTNTAASTTAPAITFYTPAGVATAPTAGDLIDVHCYAR